MRKTKVHIQTQAVIKKKQTDLEISILACWQGSTDPRSRFLKCGSIFFLPPTVTSFLFLYAEETLLETLI